MTLNTQRLQAGEKMQATLRARDEKGEAAAAWMLASIVDERFKPRPRSLSAHFLLLNEVRAGADLDDAQIVVHDSAESVQMLERFLGTHGWRRFVRGVHEDRIAKAEAPTDVNRPRPAQPLVFSRENVSLEALQKQLEDRREIALTPIQQRAVSEQAELEDQRQQAADAVRLAALALHRFEETVQLWIRAALAVVLMLLLGVSLLLMSIGVYRIARAHKPATPAFGSAFACLALGIVVTLVGIYLGPVQGSAIAPVTSGTGLAWQNRDRLLKQLVPMQPRFDDLPASAPVGTYAMRLEKDATEQQVRNKQTQPLASAKKAAETSTLALVTRSLLERERALGNELADKNDRLATDDRQMLERWKHAQDLRTTDGGEQKKGLPLPPMKAKPGKAKASAEKKAVADPAKDVKHEREYAPVFAPDLRPDTLLWSPTLWLADGTGQVRFDIATGQATYRVLLLGHTPTGRFGYYDTRLDVPAVVGR